MPRSVYQLVGLLVLALVGSLSLVPLAEAQPRETPNVLAPSDQRSGERATEDPSPQQSDPEADSPGDPSQPELYGLLLEGAYNNAKSLHDTFTDFLWVLGLILSVAGAIGVLLGWRDRQRIDEEFRRLGEAKRQAALASEEVRRIRDAVSTSLDHDLNDLLSKIETSFELRPHSLLIQPHPLDLVRLEDTNRIATIARAFKLTPLRPETLVDALIKLGRHWKKHSYYARSIQCFEEAADRAAQDPARLRQAKLFLAMTWIDWSHFDLGYERKKLPASALRELGRRGYHGLNAQQREQARSAGERALDEWDRLADDEEGVDTLLYRGNSAFYRGMDQGDDTELDRAIDQLRAAVEKANREGQESQRENAWIARVNLACVLTYKGCLDDALTELEELQRISGSPLPESSRTDPDLAPLAESEKHSARFEALFAPVAAAPAAGSIASARGGAVSDPAATTNKPPQGFRAACRAFWRTLFPRP